MTEAPVDLFRRLTHGVYVISAAHAGTDGAFTAAWVMQVSFAPLLLALSVNPHNATWPLIRDSGVFVVNVLKAGQLDLARRFGMQSGRDSDKLAGVRTLATAVGAPALAGAAAYLACRVEQQFTAGDHLLLVARPVSGRVIDESAAPLRYSETGDMDGSASLFPACFPVEGRRH